MPYLIGVALAVGVGAFARVIRLDRGAAFYPTVLMTVASYYVLFAAMAGSVRSVAIETGVMTAFVAVAAAGFRKSLWYAVLGLAAHGVFDLFHGSIIASNGVPVWWPSFCLAYDAAAALVLASLLMDSRVIIADRRLVGGVESQP